MQENRKQEAKEEIKLPKYNVTNLDPKNLIKKDEKIESLYMKRFEELNTEDLKKLTLCKAKVEHLRSERYDRFGHKISFERDVLSIKICNGLIVNRTLNELELNLIKTIVPELVSAKAECVIPVKFITFVNKNGMQGYRYNAYVCPGVYMKAFFKSQELTSICVANLQSQNKIYFYELTEEKLNVLENNVLDEKDEF